MISKQRNLMVDAGFRHMTRLFAFFVFLLLGGIMASLIYGSRDSIMQLHETLSGPLRNLLEELDVPDAAMETALSSLRSQSTWLAGQINSLPSS